MKMRPQNIKNVETTLVYLLDVLSAAERGDRERLDGGAFDFARKVLAAAEKPVRKVGMYEAIEQAINESERLIRSGQFSDADQLLLGVTREMMEKSGSNDSLRKLYAPQTSKRKQ